MFARSLFGNTCVNNDGSGSTGDGCKEVFEENGRLFYSPCPDVLIENGRVYFADSGLNAGVDQVDGKLYAEMM